jgi:hypothetical protein
MVEVEVGIGIHFLKDTQTSGPFGR